MSDSPERDLNNGSTIALTDAAGTVTNTYTYEPYGKLASSTGTAPNPFRFAGEYYDAGTGLYKIGALYYGKLLNLLGRQSVRLVEAPPGSDDWYANLLWFGRRKCLLVVHAGTLFSLFVVDVRVNDLRPFGRGIVDLLTVALVEEGLPIDALGRLEATEVRVAKTASRHVLVVMNQMAFEIEWQIDRVGGVRNLEVDELNRQLRCPASRNLAVGLVSGSS